MSDIAEKAKAPSIRFKGFTDAWEQRRVGELTNVASAARVHKEEWASSGIPFFRSSDVVSAYKGTENEKAFISHELFEQLARVSGKLEKDDILITGGGSIGIPYIVPNNEPLYSKDADLIWVKSSEKYNSRYLYTYFTSPEFRRYLSGISHIGTIAHYTIEQVKQTPVCLPSNDEQNKVGQFFEQIDNLITLHQRKFEKLQNIKKAMLEKMFPKNGSNVPELRFAGFTDAWEQRKLLDNVLKVIDFRGRTPKKLGLDWSESGYLALSALNVKNGYIDESVDAHYGDQELYDAWMIGNELHQGQVLFTTEAPMGNVAQVPDNKRYILSQRTIAFEVDEKVITEIYLATVLISPTIFNRLTALSSGGTAKGVSQKTLSELAIPIPDSVEEQNKIGEYFRNLDNLITLHQRKLEKLQNVKKACLEKMFV